MKDNFLEYVLLKFRNILSIISTSFWFYVFKRSLYMKNIIFYKLGIEKKYIIIF